MSEGACATFHDMSQSNQEDWNAIMTHNIPFSRSGGKRVIEHLKLLDGDFGGFAIDRFSTASRLQPARIVTDNRKTMSSWP